MEKFNFLKAISSKKKNNIMKEDPQSIGDYIPYVINKNLSQHVDCVMFVNEMNLRPYCDVELQFDYFINSLRERKRWYEAWYVPDKFDLVKEYYGYSDAKAKIAISILSDDDLQYIKKRLYKGGFSHG